MQRRRLGRSGITVPDICLGTMTFGSQVDEKASFRIMDEACEAGIDFFDTAEIYPVPPTPELIGITEEIIGRWLRGKPRDSLILATKVTGPGHGWFTPPVRHGRTSLDRHQIHLAVEGSLRRLQTDYIDLYQTHWPDHGMRHDETLSALTELIDQGKVRVIGCCNETSWGVMKSLWAADLADCARYDTVQNNFSLINRRCESELAQVCRREEISLLAYSPIGGGVLTGKYQAGATPEKARFSAYLNSGEARQTQMTKRFVNPRTLETTARLMAVAEDLGIALPTLAVAWSKQHDFVASTLVGVTAASQLEAILAARELVLDAATLERIDQIGREIPHPMTEDGLRCL